MAQSSVRVLVADDFEPFRRFVESVTLEDGRLQIVSEVANGLEAVQRAEELQPDLILLDIGLPGLNGIEAARKIRQLCPSCKIVFVSQQAAVDVVQVALATGARGYVVKMDAGSELLLAIHAVLRGEYFVGRRFSRDVLIPHVPPRNTGIIKRHEVFFYSDHAVFVDEFIRFLTAALSAGRTAVLVATEGHRNSILSRLRACGSDIRAAMDEGRYTSMSVADTLSRVMLDDQPDPVRFFRNAGNVITAAAEAGKGDRPRVAICGECAPLLCAKGKSEAAIRLEQLWNSLGETYGPGITCELDILCGYSMDSFHGDRGREIMRRICAEHTARPLPA